MAGVSRLMVEDELFLDPDLNLDKLASALSVPRQYISEAVNRQAGKSFNHFINEYRINKVCEEMKKTAYHNSSITLQELAYTCGFKSKSAFNEYFKLITGQHPPNIGGS